MRGGVKEIMTRLNDGKITVSQATEEMLEIIELNNEAVRQCGDNNDMSQGIIKHFNQ